MLRWMRSVRIAPGKFQDAAARGREIATFVEKKYGAPKISVYLDSFGQVGTMRWMTDYDDFASFEKIQGRFLADPEYHQKVSEVATKGLFIPGSAEDVMMRSM
jgi:hypothetical protein